MEQPTVYLVIAGSAIARDERGEILETVWWTADGEPDWSEAGVCDVRGSGGAEGYSLIFAALAAAEENAKALGYELVPVALA